MSDLNDLAAWGRWQHIYYFLLAHGDMTSGEYYEITGMNTGKKAITQSRARFTELYYEGKLVKLPRRVCKVTGNKATVWRALKPPWQWVTRPVTRKQMLKRMNMAVAEQAREHALRYEAERELTRLKAIIAELRSELQMYTMKKQ